MYIPRWFKEDRLNVLHDAIERIAFGILVTNSPSGLLASHIPMFVDRTRGSNGTLCGHIARENSQWRDSISEAEALAIFLGPEIYITPNWYPTTRETGKVVPTWNYVAVHAYGLAKFFDDKDRLLDLVTHLTEIHEKPFEDPWKVSSAPREYIEGELKSIVGFEMPISKIEGKWKLNQNRTEADRAGVIRGLDDLHDARADAVSMEMKLREDEKTKSAI
jgi:transcriptional regulator